MMGSASGFTVILLATAISALMKSFYDEFCLTAENRMEKWTALTLSAIDPGQKHSRERVRRMPLRKGSRKLYRVGSTLYKI